MQQEYINAEKPRRLTKLMIELLMDCHERELMDQTPPDACSQTAAGLIRRKLVTVAPYINEKGKTIMSIYISYHGKRFLNGDNNF